jgi:hypothetical protein
MCESAKNPYSSRRAVADSRGIRRNLTGAGHDEGQAGIIESGVWPRGTSPGLAVDLHASDLDVEASASGSDRHDVLEKIEALEQTALRGVEPILSDGAGI